MTPKERYKKLKEHLQEENPLLVEVIDEYKNLDEIAKDVGFLDQDETYTASISWWPLISILGTFSAGKSSFINEYLGKRVQETGNQAVDDKFTVICYTKSEEPITLPGVALDADPRFPFYNISHEIGKLDKTDTNINRYLQLKGVDSPHLKGKILIDSPGFDADEQRDATLKITKHIIDLSDLVLIFFDARHPEPGAMRDTLDKLVALAISHNDSDKVLYILNQIDTCAKEDNLEEIIGAWQRALSKKGIVSGKFYAIYNESLAHIEDEAQRERLKRKKDEDLAKIVQKIDKVVIDRAYRIVKNVETKAKRIAADLEPLQRALAKYKRSLLIVDVILLVAALGAFVLALDLLQSIPYAPVVAGSLLLVAAVALHFKLKSSIASFIAKRIDEKAIKKAFIKRTRWFRPYLLAASLKRESIEHALEELIAKSRSFIQQLNDRYIAMTHRSE